jgi:hypothetical protein
MPLDWRGRERKRVLSMHANHGGLVDRHRGRAGTGLAITRDLKDEGATVPIRSAASCLRPTVAAGDAN